LILLGASVLRFLRIDNRDFWYDEAFTGVAIKERFWGMIDMIIKDVHPPLYYVSVKIFSSFFGYSVFGIRLYSAIFGVLGIWVVYLLTKNLFGKKAALWASAVMAISPFAIQYSQEARMYAMFGFLFTLASHFFIRGLQTEEKKYYYLWGLFLGLSALTHYMGIITAPIFFLVSFGWRVFEDRKVKEKYSFLKLRKMIFEKKVLLGYGVFGLFFSFWIPVFARHILKAGSLTWIKPATIADIFKNIQIFIFGSPLGEMTGGTTGIPIPSELSLMSSESMLVMVAMFSVAIMIYLFGKEEKKEKIAGVFILSFGYLIAIYILSMLGIHYLVSRYILPVAYVIFIILGLWLSKIKSAYAIVVFLTYIVLSSSVIPVPNSTGWQKFQRDAGKFQGREFYIFNPFDYVIAKSYIGSDDLIIYNLELPAHSYAEKWAAIGQTGKRTENFDDIRNNNGIIISNVIIKDEINGKEDETYRKNLNLNGISVLAKYDNVILYEFK
jgi:hypothetical protein